MEKKLIDWEERLEHFKTYGWSVNEDNLKTLPADAPAGAKALAEWLTLEGRRSSLEEWLGVLQLDGRIHGELNHIGAWTERMSHKAPNMANIVSPWPQEVAPQSVVEKVKAKYDRKLRELWSTDKILVGTDAAGIQLRVLCCYMESEVYREAILRGDKALKTDIHSVNQRALGQACRSRDDAKTFVYAWLLGASVPKVAAILGCTIPQAKKAVDSFLEALPELKRLKEGKIKMDATRGYFVGFDGRKVKCNSQHLMLAGYLQNGEAIIVKNWVLEFCRRAKAEGLDFKMVNVVHDETIVEVPDMQTAERIQAIQKASMDWVNEKFQLFCPMDIESAIGTDWSQIH